MIRLLKAIIIVIAAFAALFALIYLTKAISRFVDNRILRKEGIAKEEDKESDSDGQETD